MNTFKYISIILILLSISCCVKKKKKDEEQINDTVQKFNTKIELFPFNLIAGFLGFEMVSYYSLGPSSSERDRLKINF